MTAAGRTCTRCDIWKPASGFYRRADGAAGGLYSACKVCWLARVPAKLRGPTIDGGTRRCSRCSEWKPFAAFGARRKGKREGQLRSWCLACGSDYIGSAAGRQRRYSLVYGVAPGWYEATLAAQGGRCAACRQPPAANDRLAVDHDHLCCSGRVACGRCVRGLLCQGCNVALGMLADDQDRIRRAVAYLKRHGVDPD